MDENQPSNESSEVKEKEPENGDEEKNEKGRRGSVSSEDSFEDFRFMNRARGYRPVCFPISAGEVGLTGRETGFHLDQTGSGADRRHAWCCDDHCELCGLDKHKSHLGYRGWLVQRSVYGVNSVQDRLDYQTPSSTQPTYLQKADRRSKDTQGFWAPTNHHCRFAKSFSESYKQSFRDTFRAPNASETYTKRMRSSLQYDPNPPSVIRTNLNEQAPYSQGYQRFFQKLDSRVAKFDPLQRMLQPKRAWVPGDKSHFEAFPLTDLSTLRPRPTTSASASSQRPSWR